METKLAGERGRNKKEGLTNLKFGQGKQVFKDHDLVPLGTGVCNRRRVIIVPIGEFTDSYVPF